MIWVMKKNKKNLNLTFTPTPTSLMLKDKKEAQLQNQVKKHQPINQIKPKKVENMLASQINKLLTWWDHHYDESKKC